MRVVSVLVVFLVLTSGKRKKTKKQASRTGRQNSSARTSPARQHVQVTDRQALSSPDYDRQRRLRGLDGWLKSGLIDRSEYLVLKERYEKDL